MKVKSAPEDNKSSFAVKAFIQLLMRQKSETKESGASMSELPDLNSVEYHKKYRTLKKLEDAGLIQLKGKKWQLTSRGTEISQKLDFENRSL